MLLAAGGRVASKPSNTAVSFFRLSPGLAWAECFRWRSTWFVAASCTFSSWLNPILILVPCSLERLGNFWCWCPKLHGNLCSAPGLRSRRWRLICSKTAANQNRLQPQSQANLCYIAHGLSGEVRHLDVATFVHGHRHGGCLTHCGL